MCGFLQVNPAGYKDIKKSRVSLDLKIVNEPNSFSMIRIKQFGNNTCHDYLGIAIIKLIEFSFVYWNKRFHTVRKIATQNCAC